MILARQHGYMMKKVDVKWKFILPNQQVHIYTGNGLKGKVEGKNGIYYPFRGAYASKHVIFRTARTTRSFLLQHWLREKYSKAIPCTSSL